jgi:hypothetical protein
MYVLFFPTLKVRKIKSNPSFSKIQLRKQVIRTLPKAARQSYGEIKRSGPKSVTLTLKFTKQDRDLVRRSKRAVSAGSHPPNPQNFPPNISTAPYTKGQAYWRGQQIGPTSIRRGGLDQG